MSTNFAKEFKLYESLFSEQTSARRALKESKRLFFERKHVANTSKSRKSLTEGAESAYLAMMEVQKYVMDKLHWEIMDCRQDDPYSMDLKCITAHGISPNANKMKSFYAFCRKQGVELELDNPVNKNDPYDIRVCLDAEDFHYDEDDKDDEDENAEFESSSYEIRIEGTDKKATKLGIHPDKALPEILAFIDTLTVEEKLNCDIIWNWDSVEPGDFGSDPIVSVDQVVKRDGYDDDYVLANWPYAGEKILSALGLDKALLK